MYRKTNTLINKPTTMHILYQLVLLSVSEMTDVKGGDALTYREEGLSGSEVK